MHILLTRPLEDCSEMIVRFKSLGHQVSHLPLLNIEKINFDEINFSEFKSIIFTSANGAQEFMRLFFLAYEDIRSFGPMRIACVGEATAAIFRAFHLDVELIPKVSTAENLAQELVATNSLDSANILVITGNRNREVLVSMLETVGHAIVDVLPLYDTDFYDVSKAEDLENFRDKGADAIICLSGGKYSRVPESLRLWNQGFAPLLFVTDEKPRNSNLKDLELNNLKFANEVTRRMKFSAKWELLPSTTGGATSTFDEAQDTLVYAKKKGWKKVILVTDEFHTRRSMLAFTKVFEGSQIEVQIAGAPNEIFDAMNWWKSDSGILAYFAESIKYPIYWLWDSEPKVVENN